MAQTDTQALNKRLAEWAGFTWHKKNEYVHGYLMHGGSWCDGHWDYNSKCWYEGTDGEETHFDKDDPPIFTDSLDACFQWLVPKVAEIPNLHIIDYQYIGFSKDIDLLRHSWSIILRDDKADYSASNNNPALALCRAIEELIDEKDSTSN